MGYSEEEKVMRKFNYVVCAFSTVLFLSLCCCSKAREDGPSPQSVKRLTSVSGGAWVERKNGDSTILRGLNVYLCTEETATAIKATRDYKWDDFLHEHPDHTNSDWYYFRLILALDDMEAVAKAQATLPSQNAKAGIDGKYSISEVSPGSYYLFAQTSNDYYAGYWMVPIVVDGSKPIHVDLDNSNTAEMYNVVHFGD